MTRWNKPDAGRTLKQGTLIKSILLNRAGWPTTPRRSTASSKASRAWCCGRSLCGSGEGGWRFSIVSPEFHAVFILFERRLNLPLPWPAARIASTLF